MLPLQARYHTMDIGDIDYTAYGLSQKQQRAEEDRRQVLRLGPYRYYAVFDGHGGPKQMSPYHIAHRAENHLHHYLANALRGINLNNVEAVKAVIINTFLFFDAEHHKNMFYFGCTCTILLIDDELGVVYQINLGDSKSIIFNDKGILSETVDHDPSTPSETDRIRRSGGHVYEGRITSPYGSLAVSRAFGDYEYKISGVSAVPDIIISRKVPGSRALITSDAPFERNKHTSKTLVYFTHQVEQNISDIQTIAETLVEAVAQYSTDDTTVIYVPI